MSDTKTPRTDRAFKSQCRRYKQRKDSIIIDTYVEDHVPKELAESLELESNMLLEALAAFARAITPQQLTQARVNATIALNAAKKARES
jgi:hypothetical protein